jgi:hypothetical protein
VSFRKAKDLKKRLNEVDEDKLKGVELEKGDMTAMIIAAMITFIPPILVVCAIIYFVVALIFLR